MQSEDWKFIEDTIVVDDADYICELSEYRRGADQMVFIHLTVRKWSLRVLKRLLHEFYLLREHVTCPLYANPGPDDSGKWEAFVELLGFKFLTNVVCKNGQQRKLFVHIKNNKAMNVSQLSAKYNSIK